MIIYKIVAYFWNEVCTGLLVVAAVVVVVVGLRVVVVVVQQSLKICQFVNLFVSSLSVSVLHPCRHLVEWVCPFESCCFENI